MSKKDVKVYFLGNKLGHSYHKLFPSKMTNKRKYEESAFFELDGIKRTHFINNADISELFYSICFGSFLIWSDFIEIV